MAGTDSSATKAKGKKPKAPTLAERAIEELKKAREAAGSEPLTMRELAERLGVSGDELVSKTLKGVLVTQKALDAPVMLPDDAQTYANSDRLLRFAVSNVAGQPPWDVKKFLTGIKLPKDLKPKFQESFQGRIQDKTLPADLREKFTSSAPKARPLGQRAVDELKKARAAGGSEPLSMRELAQRLGMPVEELLQPPTIKGVLVAHKLADAPVMLSEDAEAFAGSDRLLRFAVSQFGAPTPWESKGFLKALKLPKQIKPTFQASLEKRLAIGDLPQDIKDKFTQTVPPQEIGAKLLSILREFSARGPSDYPVVESTLLSTCRLPVGDAEKKKGLKNPAFAHEAIAVKVGKQSYYVLRQDASCDGLEGALRSAEAKSNGKSEGFELDELVASVATKNTPRFAIFKAALSTAVEKKTLPPGIGVLRVKGKAILFRTALIPTSTSVSTPAVVAQGAPSAVPDFSKAFEAAFERLRAKAGGRNFIKIFDLRREVPQFSREAFDAGLRKLREADKFTVDSYEGNSRRYPEEEIQAGIREGNAILIHVSRKGG